MTVGSPTMTGKPQVGLRYQCLQGQNRGRELDNFPTGPCSGGIFTTHHFPASVYSSSVPPFFPRSPLTYVAPTNPPEPNRSCWDGKNLDSPDHQSHMYNTI